MVVNAVVKAKYIRNITPTRSFFYVVRILFMLIGQMGQNTMFMAFQLAHLKGKHSTASNDIFSDNGKNCKFPILFFYFYFFFVRFMRLSIVSDNKVDSLKPKKQIHNVLTYLLVIIVKMTPTRTARS